MFLKVCMDIKVDVRCQRLMYIYGIKKMVLFINGASISNGSCAQKMHQLKVPGHLSIRDVKHTTPGLWNINHYTVVQHT